MSHTRKFLPPDYFPLIGFAHSCARSLARCCAPALPPTRESASASHNIDCSQSIEKAKLIQWSVLLRLLTVWMGKSLERMQGTAIHHKEQHPRQFQSQNPPWKSRRKKRLCGAVGHPQASWFPMYVQEERPTTTVKKKRKKRCRMNACLTMCKYEVVWDIAKTLGWSTIEEDDKEGYFTQAHLNSCYNDHWQVASVLDRHVCID